MKSKPFNFIVLISTGITITATVLSLVGITVTGFYPGIIILCLLTIIPVLSRYYAKRITETSDIFQRRSFTMLTIINIITIMVTIWMAFVIMVDRVFSKLL